MLRSMYSGISGMKVNQTKLDVIGNNIANVSTTAFKSSRAEFKDMLYQNTGFASSPTTTKGGTNAKQVGLGAQLSSINKMMGQGNAMSTGRSLDVCVDGDGYIIVAAGPINGKITVNTDYSINIDGGDMTSTLFTRDGNLTLDKDGNLLTADGYRVMGYAIDGTTIEYQGTPPAPTITDAADAEGATAVEGKLIPLVIPDKVTVGGKEQPIRTFEIGKDGLITAVLGSGSRVALGQIAMSTFKNPEGLNSKGGNLLEVSSNSGKAIIKSQLGAAADVDNSGGFGDLIQGALEGSNVDLTEQFTDMIVATRAFQASSKMISNGDEVLQTITGLIR